MFFDKPKQTPDGRYFLKIKNDNKKPYLLQLNKSTFKTDFDESNDCTIDLSNVGVNEIKKVDELILSEAEKTGPKVGLTN